MADEQVHTNLIHITLIHTCWFILSYDRKTKFKAGIENVINYYYLRVCGKTILPEYSAQPKTNVQSRDNRADVNGYYV